MTYMSSSAINPNQPTSSTQTNLPPILKGTGAISGRIFQRLKFDAQSMDAKTSSLAILKFSDRRNPLSRLKNRWINHAIKKGKLITAEFNTTDSAGAAKTQRIAVNVNSLSNRLGLDAKSMQENVNFTPQKLGEIVSNVYESTNNEYIRRFLTDQNSGTVIPQEVAKLFLSRVTHPENQATRHVISGHKFIALGNVLLSQDRKGAKLGEGTFGTAYRVQALSFHTMAVTDLATKVSNTNLLDPRFDLRAVEDLKFEAENLQFIASELAKNPDEAISRGLQDPPHGVSFENNRGNMVGKLYKGDCWDVVEGKIPLSTGSKLKGMDGLMRGLAFTQGIGLIHVDIKPGNIFYDTDQKGNPQFKLADWGGARDVRKLPPNGPPVNGMTTTPHYVPSSELQLCRSCTVANQIPLQRISTFEMGAAMFEVLAGADFDPYPRDPQNALLTQYPFNRAALQAYPEPVVNFIALLMDPNPENRPIGESIAKQWDALVSQYGSLEQMCKTVDRVQPERFRAALQIAIPGLRLFNDLTPFQASTLMRGRPEGTWIISTNPDKKDENVLYQLLNGNIQRFTIAREHLTQLQANLHPSMQWKPQANPPMAAQDQPI